MKSSIKYFLIFIFALTLTAFAKPQNIDPDYDYYRTAMDAWKKQKNYTAAAENMRLSYFQKPDSYRLYWYTYFLHMDENYDETIEVLESVPKSDWYPLYWPRFQPSIFLA